MTTSQIILTFMSADGKTSSIRVPDCKTTVTLSDVNTAATHIISSAALECGENQPATLLTGAKKVETTSTVYKYAGEEDTEGDDI